jgi:GT2 family glycosyltransferase
MSGKASIIIVNWNRKEDTIECLDSVYRIDHPDYDVVVVDNGSTDGSVDAIKAKFPKAALLPQAKNTGFCIANNLAIKYALQNGAEYLLILNNDMVVEPSILTELTKVLDSDKAIGAVSPLIAYYNDPKSIWFIGCRIDWGNGELMKRYAPEDMAKGLLDTDIVSWGAVLTKREAIDSVGYLDERFFLYYDDTDWSVRCRKKGFKTVSFTKVLAYHKSSRSSGGAYSPVFYYYYTRNKMIFMRKHAGIIRKLAFSVHYLRHAFHHYERLMKEGNIDGARAIMDGLWSGIRGLRYDEKEPMPQNLLDKAGLKVKIYLWALALKEVLKKP